MAESPAHRFGQLIGGLLESVLRPQLDAFCKRQGLFSIISPEIDQRVGDAR